MTLVCLQAIAHLELVVHVWQLLEWRLVAMIVVQLQLVHVTVVRGNLGASSLLVGIRLPGLGGVRRVLVRMLGAATGAAVGRVDWHLRLLLRMRPTRHL